MLLVLGLVSARAQEDRLRLALPGEATTTHFRMATFFDEGNVAIAPTTNPNLLTIYGTRDPDRVHARWHNGREGKTEEAIFQVLESERAISSLWTEEVSTWQVFLAQHKRLDMDLAFGTGAAEIDLSGLSVKSLAVRSAKATIRLRYQPSRGNAVKMDTLTLHCRMGKLRVENLHLGRVRVINGRVEYGELTLLFPGKNDVDITQMNLTVGLGKLIMQLPSEQVPVRITFEKGAMGDVILPKSYHGQDGVWMNDAYYVTAPGVLEINLKVEGGTAIFSE